MPKPRIRRTGKSGSHVWAARSAPGADIPARIPPPSPAASAGLRRLLAGVGSRVRRVRREQIDFAPYKLERRADVVVVEADIDTHVAVGALPGEDVDAQLRAAAFQVPPVGVPGAQSGLDDPI